MRKVGLILLMLLIPVFAYGADVAPTAVSGGYYWDLTSGITATGNSDTMVGRLDADNCMACITTSSTTSMTAAFIVGQDSTYVSTAATYTLSSDTTHCFGLDFPIPRMYVTFTITTGQVDDMYVYCSRR